MHSFNAIYWGYLRSGELLMCQRLMHTAFVQWSSYLENMKVQEELSCKRLEILLKPKSAHNIKDYIIVHCICVVVKKFKGQGF